MGYHLTILRTSGGERIPILENEFASACSGDPRLTFDGNKVAASVRVEGRVLANFNWQDGEIWTNTAEDQVLEVALDLAKKIGARVRGDEMETFRTTTETYLHPDDAPLVAESQSSDSATRQRRVIWNLIRLALIVGVLILIVLNAVRR